MKENFETGVHFVLMHEGYKSEDPDDPGGRTIFGISERSHPEVVAELWDLPKQQAMARAEEFYRREYWGSVCDSLPWPMDIYHFDCEVNLGIGRAAMILHDSAGIPLRYLMLRLAFYNKLSNVKYFRGWVRRVIDLWELSEARRGKAR